MEMQRIPRTGAFAAPDPESETARAAAAGGAAGRRGRRHVVATLAVAALVASGCSGVGNDAALGTPEPTATGADRTVTVNGKELVYECFGEGSPTVVFLHGLAPPFAADYDPDLYRTRATMEAMGAATRSCFYGRAGTHGSPPPPGPQTLTDLTDDTMAFVDAVGIDAPVVLAGHSLGGLIAMAAAQQQPGRVAGLLLVESSHPDVEGPAEILEPELVDLDSPHGFDPAVGLGDLPITVLTADRQSGGDHGWRFLQRELTRLSSNARQAVVDDTDHVSIVWESDAIAEAIDDLLARIDGTAAPATVAMPTPPAEAEATVEVNGQTLRYACTGEGAPTVVFLHARAGPEFADHDPDFLGMWTAVEAVAPTTRACVYARAGMLGSAPPTDTPQTFAGLTDTVHAFVDAAGIEGPVVLAGHSFGGLLALAAAQQQPERVAGLLLLDSVHPREGRNVEILGPEQIDERSPLGFDLDAGLGELPITVLSAEEPRDGGAGAWRARQGQLADLSSDARHETVEGTDHFSLSWSGEAIASAVEELLDRVDG